jgi:hypothetical protein
MVMLLSVIRTYFFGNEVKESLPVSQVKYNQKPMGYETGLQSRDFQKNGLKDDLSFKRRNFL